MTLIIMGAVGFLVFVTVFYFVSVYNGLIKVSRNIDKSWANIEVILKQRHDEIPKIIAVCDNYMHYERETLEKLTAARVSCIQAKNVAETSQAEGDLAKSLKNVFAVAENYPDLKANQNFKQVQDRVSFLEGQLADRREFYNDSVNLYNIRINEFPDMIFARQMNLQLKNLFKVADEDMKEPEITFDLPK